MQRISTKLTKVTTSSVTQNDNLRLQWTLDLFYF